jgi:3-oxoacyl-[acyl-carrier protein] reductase
MLLKDKTVLITGANRGIGKAIAGGFAREGARLFLLARQQDSLGQLCRELKNNHGVEVDPLYVDLADPDQIKQAFQSLLKVTKVLDVLVNNAGILDSALLGMVNPALVEKTFRVNTFAVIYCMHYASRLMARKKSGSIINITSIMGIEGAEGQTVYSGSKAALTGITRSAAKELAPLNIRVNAIAPGFIDTDMTRDLPEEIFNQRLDSIKMKRIGTPEEVANCALFLASDMSSYITGQMIGVDGGMVL